MHTSLQYGMIVAMALVISTAFAAENMPQSVPGELLVKTRVTLKSVDMQQLLPEAKKSRRLTRQITKFTLPPETTFDEAATRLKQNPVVEYVQPNYIKYLQQVPNDPGFNQQWALQNTGQRVPASGGVTGTSGADIKATDAWEISQGDQDIVIAIIDSGIDLTHPDLKTNLWTNSAESAGLAGIDDDGNGRVDDVNGWDFVHNDNRPLDLNNHGTRIAGIIAAAGNNGSDVTGVMWRASLMPLQVFDPRGFATTENIVSAIDYAIANGADLINASFGAPGVSNPFSGGFDQLEYEALQRARNAGIPVIAAACNNFRDNDTVSDGLPCVPASYDLSNIIAVAATDQDDMLATFSNYGAETVDVAAPGTNIISTSAEFTTVWDFPLISLAGATVTADPPVDLQNRQGCRLSIDRSQISTDVNGLQVEASADGSNWLSVSSDPSLDAKELELLYDLSAMDGNANVLFRLTPLAGGQPVSSDVLFNPVSVQCYSGLHDPNKVTVGQGTSLSSAYVTGVAGLIYAHFGHLNPNVLYDRILQTVDENPAELAGIIKSGGRVNAARALGGTISAPAPPASGDGGGGAFDAVVVLVSLFYGLATCYRRFEH